jgi:hypothetical protein
MNTFNGIRAVAASAALERTGVGMRRLALVALGCGMLNGCTSVELTSATTALAPAINTITLNQVYSNLALYIDACQAGGSCNVVPSQFVLGGGQVQVSNQIQAPNLTANFHGRTISSLAFQDQNQWTQNWSLTPVTDFSDLERLRDLYRLAVQLTPDDAAANKLLVRDFADRYLATQVKGLDPGTQNLSKLVTGGPITGAAAGGISIDEAPLPLPIDTSGAVNTDPSTWRYPLPGRKWIYWDLAAPPAGFENVGRFAGHHLYIARGGLQNFLIWISGATANTSGGGGKAPGGGSKGASGLSFTPIQ